MNWIREHRRDQITRRADFLKEQLRNLYGPLFHYLSYNREIFAFAGKISDVYKEVFCQREYPIDREAAEALEAQAINTINLGNEYVKLAMENNVKIEDVLVANFNYIDIDDLEMARLFRGDRMRARIELEKKEERPQIPFRVIYLLGTVIFYRDDFTKQIELKFHSKVQELRRLQERMLW